MPIVLLNIDLEDLPLLSCSSNISLLPFQIRSIEKLENPTDEELPVTGLNTFMTVLKEGIQERLINDQARTWKIATFLNPR
jgi:hypothetical protein